MTRLLLSATLLATSAAPTLSHEPYGAHGRTVSAEVYVAAAPSAVYRVLTDYAHMHEFMPLVTKVEPLSEGAGKARIKFTFKFMRLMDFAQVDEREFDPPHRITFRSVEGPLKSAAGVWRVRPEGSGARLSYRISAEPPFVLPGAMMEYLVRRAALELIDGIRRRAESGGAWKKGQRVEAG